MISCLLVRLVLPSRCHARTSDQVPIHIRWPSISVSGRFQFAQVMHFGRAVDLRYYRLAWRRGCPHMHFGWRPARYLASCQDGRSSTRWSTPDRPSSGHCSPRHMCLCEFMMTSRTPLSVHRFGDRWTQGPRECGGAARHLCSKPW